MSENLVERMYRLREELAALENNPQLRSLLDKSEALNAKVAEMGLTPKAAAEILVPQSQASTSGPMVTLEGRRRIPISPGKKLLLQSNLLAVRKEIDDLLARLESDPEVQKRVMLLEVLGELELSHIDAAELLSPGIMQNAMKPVARTTSNAQRPARYWRNPHSNEIVKARSTANTTLRRWVEEHGKEILANWQIEGDEVPEELQD